MFLCMCIPVFIGELYISDAVINNRINVYNTQVSPAFAYRVRVIYIWLRKFFFAGQKPHPMHHSVCLALFTLRLRKVVIFPQ